MLRIAVVLCHALLFAFAVPVHAQHEEKPNARARPLFEAGREAYVEGRYREAAEAFERVFALTGHPFMLRNLGNAYEKLGEREKAVAALHQYLRLLPDAEDRSEIEARARLLEQEPAVAPAVAAAVPSAEAKPAAKARVADAGSNTTATATTTRTTDANATTIGSERSEDDEVPAPPAAPPAAHAHIDASDAGLFAGRTFTWISLGASVALATTAGFFWLDAHSQYDKLAMSCGAHGGCSEAQLQGVTHGITATNVTLALSGVAFAGAIALFFIEGDATSEADARARLVPSVSPHGAELTWRGRL